MAATEQQSFDAVQKALTDLSTAVDNETTQSNAVADEIKLLLQDGRNAVSAAQWQQVADNIEAKVSQMQTNNKNIADTLAATAAPAPATTEPPAPTTEPTV